MVTVTYNDGLFFFWNAGIVVIYRIVLSMFPVKQWLRPDISLSADIHSVRGNLTTDCPGLHAVKERFKMEQQRAWNERKEVECNQDGKEAKERVVNEVRKVRKSTTFNFTEVQEMHR